MTGWGFPSILLRKYSKNWLPAEMMTLWASTKLSPSQARVTSQKTLLSSARDKKDDIHVWCSPQVSLIWSLFMLQFKLVDYVILFIYYDIYRPCVTIVLSLHPCCWRVCYKRGLPRLVFISWLSWTYSCLGPIQTQLKAFSGFLRQTKMKADTKLIVKLCCPIFDKKSVAPSSGDCRRRSGPRQSCRQVQE